MGRTTARGTTTYAYNGDGTLVSQTASSVTTRSTQDLAAPLSQVLQTQVGSAARTDYLYGLNRLASLTSGVRTWYAADALGSVRRTVTDAGVPLGVINYDPWGTPETGTVPTFGFTGEVQDASAGLVNLRARWYSTGQGRFTSVDPYAGVAETPYSLHQYQYGYGNPVLWTDPSGNAPGSPNTAEGIYIHAVIQMHFLSQFPFQANRYRQPMGGEIEMPLPIWGWADMGNHPTMEFYEIKPNSPTGRSGLITDLDRDQFQLNRRYLSYGWKGGSSYTLAPNYGLWPIGLDIPNYNPIMDRSQPFYIIRAMYAPQQGGILYWADKLNQSDDPKQYNYDPVQTESFIQRKYPPLERENYPGGAIPLYLQPVSLDPNIWIWNRIIGGALCLLRAISQASPANQPVGPAVPPVAPPVLIP